eukprot:304700_1
MSGRLSTYESSQSWNTILNLNSTASTEDDLFVTKLLSTFVNKQSAVFHRWVKIHIEKCNINRSTKLTKYTSDNQQPKAQLLVLTPLKIISLPTIVSPKHIKQFKIINIISLFVEENADNINSKNKTKTTKTLTKPKKLICVNNKRKKNHHITSYPILQYKSTSTDNDDSINNAHTFEEKEHNAWIYHCNIKLHRLDPLEMSYDKLLSQNRNNLEHDILDIYFESKDV